MGEEAARPKETIFVSDPSAEAEQIATSLRARGYVVVDVPFAMLLARVAVQRPRIVIVDADADGKPWDPARVRRMAAEMKWSAVRTARLTAR